MVKSKEFQLPTLGNSSHRLLIKAYICYRLIIISGYIIRNHKDLQAKGEE